MVAVKNIRVSKSTPIFAIVRKIDISIRLV